MVNLIIGNLKK